MKKKKERKCFLSCRMIERSKFQNALNTKYQLMFTDALEDADIFIAPMDRDGLSDRQKKDFERAEALGISSRFAVEADKLLDREGDPLNLSFEEEIEVENTGEIMEEDEGFELELI